jgi:hypothetical protein
MVHEGKDLGLWEWKEMAILEDKDINIVQEELTGKHPISEKRGE